MMMSCAMQKLFSFTRYHSLIVDLSAWASDILFRKSLSEAVSFRLFSTFVCVCVFTLRSLINLQLSFVQGNKYVSMCVL